MLSGSKFQQKEQAVTRRTGTHGDIFDMKKLSLMFAMLSLLAGVSVKAQENELVTVQDDATKSFLVFNIKSGEYKFIRCGDQNVLYGIGKVTIDGCNVYLEDVSSNKRVVASVNICDQEGKAAVEVFEAAPATNSLKSPAAASTPMKEYLKDSSMKDNTPDCVK